MQTLDARAAKTAAGIFLHETRDVRVDRWGTLFLGDKPQDTDVDLTITGIFILVCVGSHDVEQNILDQLAKSQFAPALKRVLKKMAGQELNLVGEYMQIREGL